MSIIFWIIGEFIKESGNRDKVIIASRRKTPPKLENIEIVRWDIQTPLSSEIMSGIDAVINTENTGTCVPVFSCIFIFILYFQS